MKKALVIIDSPINVLMLSSLIKDYITLDVILARSDSAKKNYDYYLGDILQKSKKDVMIFDYNLHEFWSKNRNDVEQIAKNFLSSFPLKDYETVFCNSFTNPFSIHVTKLLNFEHLYHSPTDFFDLFPLKVNTSIPIIKKLKFKLSYFKRFRTLKNIKFSSPLEMLDFINGNTLNDFNPELASSHLINHLNKWDAQLGNDRKHIMLLISGEEPMPGAINDPIIQKYLRPHEQGLEHLAKIHNISNHTLYIKEHKAYRHLNISERKKIMIQFGSFVKKIVFVHDIIPEALDKMPGELLFLNNKISIIIGEPSSLLFNVLAYVDHSFAIISYFQKYRDQDQKERNNEFLKINKFLKKKVINI